MNFTKLSVNLECGIETDLETRRVPSQANESLIVCIDNQGQKVPSGMYIYRIKAGDFIADKKMLIVK